MLITIMMLAMQAHAMATLPRCVPPPKQLIVTPCEAGEGCVETWSWQDPELDVS